MLKQNQILGDYLPARLPLCLEYSLGSLFYKATKNNVGGTISMSNGLSIRAVAVGFSLLLHALVICFLISHFGHAPPNINFIIFVEPIVAY